MAILQFRQGDPLSVHRALLQRHPKLAILDTSDQDIWSSATFQVSSMNHISRAAGHVLVHFLYTDSYQALGWIGGGSQDEKVAKLRTGFEVLAAARQFELGRLEELAKEQIWLLSKEIDDAFTVVDVVIEAFPRSPGGDTWFSTYMKAIIKLAFEGGGGGGGGARGLARSSEPPEKGERDGVIPTTGILLRGAVEVHREMVEELELVVRDVPVATPEEEPEPVPSMALPSEHPQPQEEDTTSKKHKGQEPRHTNEPNPEPMPADNPPAEPTAETKPAPEAEQHKPIQPEATPLPGPSQQWDDDLWALPTKKDKKKKSKSKKEMKGKDPFGSWGAGWGAAPEPEPATAAIPNQTPEKEKEKEQEKKKEEGNTNANTNTASDGFGGWCFPGGFNGGSSTPFGTTTTIENKMNADVVVGRPPGTALPYPEFVPTTLEEANNPRKVERFQNNLFMDAYKGWSSEELRLADYSQGYKQGIAGGGFFTGESGFGFGSSN